MLQSKRARIRLSYYATNPRCKQSLKQVVKPRDRRGTPGFPASGKLSTDSYPHFGADSIVLPYLRAGGNRIIFLKNPAREPIHTIRRL